MIVERSGRLVRDRDSDIVVEQSRDRLAVGHAEELDTARESG